MQNNDGSHFILKDSKEFYLKDIGEGVLLKTSVVDCLFKVLELSETMQSTQTKQKKTLKLLKSVLVSKSRFWLH